MPASGGVPVRASAFDPTQAWAGSLAPSIASVTDWPVPYLSRERSFGKSGKLLPRTPARLRGSRRRRASIVPGRVSHDVLESRAERAFRLIAERQGELRNRLLALGQTSVGLLLTDNVETACLGVVLTACFDAGYSEAFGHDGRANSAARIAVSQVQLGKPCALGPSPSLVGRFAKMSGIRRQLAPCCSAMGRPRPHGSGGRRGPTAPSRATPFGSIKKAAPTLAPLANACKDTFARLPCRGPGQRATTPCATGRQGRAWRRKAAHGDPTSQGWLRPRIGPASLPEGPGSCCRSNGPLAVLLQGAMRGNEDSTTRSIRTGVLAARGLL